MNLVDIEIVASGSTGNTYLIHEMGRTILIDPGITVPKLRKATSMHLSEIEFALVSHEHKDHCKGLMGLARLGIHVAGSYGTFRKFDLDGLMYSTLAAEREWRMNGWEVLPFAIAHDAAEPLGFLIRTPNGAKICYASDTAYIEPLFKDVEYWIIEVNHDKELLKSNQQLPTNVKRRIRNSHFEVSNAIAFFMDQDMSKAQRIYLIHLSGDNSDREEFTEKVQKACGVPVYIN